MLLDWQTPNTLFHFLSKLLNRFQLENELISFYFHTKICQSHRLIRYILLFESKTLTRFIIHHLFCFWFILFDRINFEISIFSHFRNEKSNGVPVDSPDAPMSPSGSNTVKKVWSPTSPTKATTNGFPGGDNEVSCFPLKWNRSVTSHCFTFLGSESYRILL